MGGGWLGGGAVLGGTVLGGAVMGGSLLLPGSESNGCDFWDVISVLFQQTQFISHKCRYIKGRRRLSLDR